MDRNENIVDAFPIETVEPARWVLDRKTGLIYGRYVLNQTGIIL